MPAKKVLKADFFDRPTLTVAKDLLGKYLVRGKHALMITEVEAYDGPLDRASHASRGRTPRTSIMFGPPGYLYVYFTYGMHWLVNVVAGPEHYPAAVLIRAGMYADKKTGAVTHVIGPARLTKFMGIDGALNGLRANRTSKLWFEDRGIHVRPSQIIAGPRVGVDYAGPYWSRKKYNFKLKLPAGASA